MRCLAMIVVAACGAPAAQPAPAHAQAPLVAASSRSRAPFAIDRAKWSPLAGAPDITPTTLVRALDDSRVAVVDVETLAGAIYDASTDKWQPIAPPAKVSKVEGWPTTLEHAGDYLLVMPRMRYHLGKRAWSPIDNDGAPRGQSHNFVLGGKVFELIPPEQNGIKDTATFSYDPAADRWEQLDMLPAVPAICANHMTIAAWGGEPDSNHEPWKLVEGAYALDARGAWQPLPAAGRPSARAYASTACSDRALYVWGGAGTVKVYRQTGDLRRDGASYDFATKQWHALPAPPDDVKFAEGHYADVVGERLVGLASDQEPGYAYDARANAWVSLATDGAPPARLYPKQMFDLGGERMLVVEPGAAASYDFAKRAWTPVEFPYVSYRGIAFLGDRLLVIGALRPPDSRGCYDGAAGRCDDGKTIENAVLR